MGTNQHEGTSGHTPHSVLETLAVMVTEAEIAKAKAQAAFQMACLLYGVSPSETVTRLKAELLPRSEILSD